MFYEVIVRNAAGMQVYKYESLDEAYELVKTRFGINEPVMDIVTIGKFNNQILIQQKNEQIPEQRIYWEDAA